MDRLPESTTDRSGAPTTLADGTSGRPRGAHPVLDRFPHIREAADQLGFECLDDTWQGRFAAYRLRCREGHEFKRTMATFGRGRTSNCPQCNALANWTRLKDLCDVHGVRCLEERWLGWDTTHRFECTKGHAWTRLGKRALGHAGCTRCARAPGYERRRSASWLRLQKVVAERGGECLATDFAGVAGVYPFRCAAGHQWLAKGSDVLRRTWCPECARLRKVNGYRIPDGLQRLCDKAAAQGGQCLSDSYEGTRGKYRFRCAHGHEWEATGQRIVRGSWCLKCAYDGRRLSLEDALAAARARGGQCLSAAYVRANMKMHWLCDRGHSWYAPLAAIRAGHWCSECSYMARITNPNSKAWKRYKAVAL